MTRRLRGIKHAPEWYRRRGWVTGAAARAICELRGLEEGDEVVLYRTQFAGFQPSCDGLVVKIKPHYCVPGHAEALNDEYLYSKFPTVAMIMYEDGKGKHPYARYVIVSKNVFAWRRPKGGAA